MKYIFIAVLSIATAFIAKAQSIQNYKDPITNKSVKVASINLGASLGMAGQKLLFSKTEKTTYISFLWMVDGNGGELFNDIDISKSQLIIKLDNDSVMRFKPNVEMSKVVVNSIMSTLALTSEIDASTLEFFKQHQMTVIRLATNGDYGADSKYKGKTKVEIQKGARFILEN